MNKSRVLRTLVVLAVVALVLVAMHEFDLLGVLRRLHGMD
jgi:hypothetical protein